MTRIEVIRELHEALRARDNARTLAEAAVANQEVQELLDLLQDTHRL